MHLENGVEDVNFLKQQQYRNKIKMVKNKQKYLKKTTTTAIKLELNPMARGNSQSILLLICFIFFAYKNI